MMKLGYHLVEEVHENLNTKPLKKLIEDLVRTRFNDGWRLVTLSHTKVGDYMYSAILVFEKTEV